MFVLDNKCLSTVDPYFRAIPIKVSDWHTLCFAAIDDLVTNRVVVPYFVCFSINLPSSWLSVPPLPSAILDGRISRDLAHIVIISRLFIMDQKYRLWKFRINTGDRPKKKKKKASSIHSHELSTLSKHDPWAYITGKSRRIDTGTFGPVYIGLYLTPSYGISGKIVQNYERLQSVSLIHHPSFWEQQGAIELTKNNDWWRNKKQTLSSGRNWSRFFLQFSSFQMEIFWITLE